MFLIALKMLFQDKPKFLTLIIGLSFSVLLILQQASIFCGLMLRAGSLIFDTGAPLWVMEETVDNTTVNVTLNDSYLYRVKNTPGVKWAVPMSVQNVEVRSDDGKTAFIQLIGLDEQSLIGMPSTILEGDVEAINRPNTVIIGSVQAERYGSPKVGDYIEINDKRVQVGGIAKTSRSLLASASIYTTYPRAKELLPPRSKYLSFILAGPQPNTLMGTVKQKIRDHTGLKALTGWEFYWETVNYLKDNTGIPINFGITIFLGVIVGAAISAQTLYTFVIENRRQFGTFKAIGIHDRTLVLMVLLQSLIVGIIGFGIGSGVVSALGLLIPSSSPVSFYTPWQAEVLTFVVVITFCVIASIISIRQLLKLDPALVFRG